MDPVWTTTAGTTDDDWEFDVGRRGPAGAALRPLRRCGGAGPGPHRRRARRGRAGPRRSTSPTPRATTPTCAGCCSTWSRSTAGTRATPTSCARPSTGGSARTRRPGGSRCRVAAGGGRRDDDLTTADAHRGATFRRHDLTEAFFDDTYLAGARFRNVDLRGAQVQRLALRRRRDHRRGRAPHGQRRRRERLRRAGAGPPGAGPHEDAAHGRRQGSARRGTSSSVGGPRRSSGPAGSTPSCCTSGSTTSGRSSRPSVTSSSRPTRGSAARCSATRRRGARSTCRTTTWPTSPGCRGTMTVRPSLDEVLELRRDRMATMRQVVDGLTDEQLADAHDAGRRAGLPRVRGFPVRRVGAASSTRSGGTTSTPSATWPSSRRATQPDPRERPGTTPVPGPSTYAARAAYGLAHLGHSTPRRALRPSSSTRSWVGRVSPNLANHSSICGISAFHSSASTASACLELGVAHVEAVGVERLRGRDVADGGLDRGGLALDALDGPLEDAAVLAEAGPQEVRRRRHGGTS